MQGQIAVASPSVLLKASVNFSNRSLKACNFLKSSFTWLNLLENDVTSDRRWVARPPPRLQHLPNLLERKTQPLGLTDEAEHQDSGFVVNPVNPKTALRSANGFEQP